MQLPVTIERGRTDVLWMLLTSPVTTSVGQPARSVVGVSRFTGGDPAESRQ